MQTQEQTTQTTQTTSETLYEVCVVADEPWHDGLRRTFNEAILDFVESNLTTEEYEASMAEEPGYIGADSQIAVWAPDEYVGYGLEAHENADMFVFNNHDTAKRFADILRYHTQVSGAAVIMQRL